MAQATLCYMGTPLPLPKRGSGAFPQFSADVCCGQTAGWIKMPLCTKVGITPGHIVTWGPSSPFQKRAQSPIFGSSIVAKRSPISATAEHFWLNMHSRIRHVRLGTSIRASNPLRAFLLAPQIRLVLTIVRVYKLYLLTKIDFCCMGLSPRPN